MKKILTFIGCVIFIGAIFWLSFVGWNSYIDWRVRLAIAQIKLPTQTIQTIEATSSYDCAGYITVYIIVDPKGGGYYDLEVSDLDGSFIFWPSYASAEKVVNEYYPNYVVVKKGLCVNPNP